MKYRVGAVLVLAALLAGCPKKQGPQTTAVEPPVKPAAALPPLEAPGEPATKPSVLPPLPPVPPEPAATSRTYTVQAGDKGLMDIARKQLGDAKRWKEIQALNPGLDTRKLKPGMQIKLPAK